MEALLELMGIILGALAIAYPLTHFLMKKSLE